MADADPSNLSECSHRADFQCPDIPAAKQRTMINFEKMLRAEDIAVGIHFMLTQPRRAVVQQLVMTQRISDEK
jgi:NADP-dependent 3-hydroxy acid dehydrogenase YdfG